MHNERDVAPDHSLVDDTRALSATRSAQALPSNSWGSRRCGPSRVSAGMRTRVAFDEPHG